MAKRKKRKKNKKEIQFTAAVNIMGAESNNPYIWGIADSANSANTTDFTATTNVDFIKKKLKPKLSTKAIVKLVGFIPDGILTKIISFGMRKLVGKIPAEKREVYFDKGINALAKIVRAASEGAVQGTAGELKYEF